MGIELVIFDCDGVLVDSEPITTRLIVEHVARLGLPMDADEALGRFKGGTLAKVIDAVEAELGRKVPETFVDDFRADLVVRLSGEVEAVPGVLDVIRELTWPACVASNGPRLKMNATLGRIGLLDTFADRIFTAYEVGTFKPDPGLFLHAADQLGARPARCVVIEDSAGGVQAGVAGGMAVFAYTGDADAGLRARFETHLEGTAGAMFDDMRALPHLLATHAAGLRQA